MDRGFGLNDIGVGAVTGRDRERGLAFRDFIGEALRGRFTPRADFGAGAGVGAWTGAGATAGAGVPQAI